MIETDPRLKKFLEQLADRPLLDLRAMNADVQRLMETIPTVRLGMKMEEQRLLLAANRSRLVGIKRDAYREHAYLVNSRGRMSDWLHSRYGNYLRNIATERGRSAAVNNALRGIDTRIAPLKTLIEVADMAIDDYNSRGFTFRDLVAAMKIGDREG